MFHNINTMHKPLFFLLALIQSFYLIAQEANEPASISEILQFMGEQEREEAVNPELAEVLSFRLQQPININAVTAPDLQSLGFLTDFQIKSIVDYVQRHAPLRSKYELQFALGLDAQTLRWLYWFVIAQPVSDNLLLKKRFNHGSVLAKTSRLLTLPKAYADSTPKYRGDPHRLYAAARYSINNKWQLGLTAEKDAGEQLSGVADFYSGYAQFDGKGRGKRLVIGDFKAQFGQGLCVGSGFGSNMLRNSNLQLRRSDRGLMRFAPSDENYFWRGMGVTFALSRIDVSVWLSHHQIDASLENDSSSQFNSLQTSGLHRTESELAGRHSVAYSAVGANASYNGESFRVGLNVISHHFGTVQVPQSVPYKRFSFIGNQLHNASVYYFVPNRYFDIWGELAVDDSVHGAMLHGVSLIPTAGFSFSIIRRDYSVAYQSFMNNSIGQGSHPQNEHGTLCAIEFSPFQTIKIKAYYDMYSTPWLRYRTSAPSVGSEQMMSLFWNIPASTISGFVQMKQKLWQQDGGETKIATLQDFSSQQWRTQVSYSPLRWLSASNRFDVNRAKELTNLKGYMIWQDIGVKWRNISFDARFALFSTDWSTRIYAVEDDLKRSFYSTLYYGEGNRWYAIVTWQSSGKDLTLQFKYSQTQLPDSKSIGSGNDAINGDVKQEYKALVSYSF